MAKTIVFLVSVKFNQRDFNRFGIEVFLRNGYLIEVWDITKLVYPTYFENYEVPDPISFKAIKSFESFTVLNNSFAALPANSMVIDFNRCFCSVSEINVFTHFKKVLLIINLNPYFDDLSLLEQKVYTEEKLSLFERFKVFIQDNFGFWFEPSPEGNYKIDSKNVYDIIVVGGAKARGQLSRYKLVESPKLISLHTLDFDLMLENSSENDLAITFGKYAVFLDEAVTTHPDFLRDGIDGQFSFCDKEVYFKQVNAAFSKIEKELNLKVIIASHPRVDYEKFGNLFDGRQIVFGKTAELVKQATLIVGHSSTSMNFAIASMKPILFLDSNNYNEKLRDKIKIKSFMIRSKPLMITTQIDALIAPIVNKIAYKRYIHNFIKESGSNSQKFWEGFCNQIKE